MRVLLCGGGTAGHVIPAIAMGEIVEKHFEGSIIAFGGREGGDENRAYLKTGHKLYTVDIRGLQRSLSVNNIKSIFKVLKSGRDVMSIIKEFKPDLIIGTGGYVCYPFVRQGQRFGIPTMLHESNAYPGLVTRLLGKRCDRVMLNLEETKNHLKGFKNTAVVGIPTLTEFGTLSKSEARRRLGIQSGEMLIVSFGGSLGAERMNLEIADMISRYEKEKSNVRYIHSTGRSHYSKIKESYPRLFSAAESIKIVPYIENMPILLSAADLAITRSGAITVCELCRSATPAILIPSPNVTANHQYKNAKHAEELGFAEVIEEKDLTAELLHDRISELIQKPKRLEKMSRAARSACSINTEDAVCKLIRELIGK